MKLKQYKKAYKKGIKACKDGKFLQDNPYKCPSKEVEAWAAGYLFCLEEYGENW